MVGLGGKLFAKVTRALVPGGVPWLETNLPGTDLFIFTGDGEPVAAPQPFCLTEGTKNKLHSQQQSDYV